MMMYTTLTAINEGINVNVDITIELKIRGM
jgi:hypothetical protein